MSCCACVPAQTEVFIQSDKIKYLNFSAGSRNPMWWWLSVSFEVLSILNPDTAELCGEGIDEGFMSGDAPCVGEGTDSDGVGRGDGSRQHSNLFARTFCTGLAIFFFTIYVMSASRSLWIALGGCPPHHDGAGGLCSKLTDPFKGWGDHFQYRMPRIDVNSETLRMKMALLGTMLGRPVNQTLLGRWDGKNPLPCACCGMMRQKVRLDMYNDHLEITYPGLRIYEWIPFWKGMAYGDNYSILLKDVTSIHAGVIRKNFCLYLAIMGLLYAMYGALNYDCGEEEGNALVAALTELSNCPVAPSTCLIVVAILLVIWFFAKTATVCIGAEPGRSKGIVAALNPWKKEHPGLDTPFWITFNAVIAADSVDSIIEQIRNQQQISERGQVGTALSG